MNFVAIDFETANRDPASACSLGLVVVKDGVITEQKQWLIQPPNLAFDYRHIKTHGITPEMVKDAPNLAAIWLDLKPYIDKQILLAHNAQFDINVLHNTTAVYNLELPVFKSVCTVELSRRAWPKLKNHKLSTIANTLGIDLDHHNSSSDALACAKIALNACNCLNLKRITDCFDLLDMQSTFETFEYVRDFWDEQGFEVHSTEDQIKRQKSAAKVCVESLDIENKIAVINGYDVTLCSCTCRDYSVRRLPCKHMYRLAIELGIFEEQPTIKSKTKKNSCTLTISADQIYEQVLSDIKDDFTCGKISKAEYDRQISRLSKIYRENSLAQKVNP